MYNILFTKKAKYQFDKLETNLQERIGKALERIKVRPESFVSKLTGLPYFKLRVGDYRIIMSIIQKELIIMVIKVGHRSNIYDKL